MPARAAKAGGATKKSSTKKAIAAAQAQEAASQPVPTITSTQKTIQNAFASSQNTTATHKKLVVTLRTLQEECANNGTEKEFKREFIKCLNRVLVVKKGETVGDRVMRFCDLFVRHIHEKELREWQEVKRKERQKNGVPTDTNGDDEEDEDVPETATTRFMTSLLKHLLYGLKAANKTVRFRSCQFLALTLNSVSALDENIFAHLKDALVKRMMDREAPVRVQASLALMKLGFGTIEESDSESEVDEDDDVGYVPGGVISRLIDRLGNDTSGEVRRAILLNMNHTPASLPHLLERSRDIDPLTRRLVYSRTLPALGDFRLLSIQMREKILRWGLQDRDQAVRKAAEKNFADGWVQNADGDLLEVLERLDVINSEAAEVAMESFWKRGTGTDVDFGAEFWQNLSAESAFLARTFNDYCRDPDTPFDHHIDDKIPEVTHLAFILQKYINLLINSPAGVPLGKNGAKSAQQDAAEVEFIVEQLLLIALKLDYGDEIGRRKMFQLLRESLAIIDLPEPTVHRIVEVLRKVSSSERDYCSVILEIISDVHDLIAPDDQEGGGDDSFHSAQSAQSADTVGPQPSKTNKKKTQAQIDEDEDMMDVDEEKDEEEEDDDEDDENDEKAIKEMMTNLRCLFIAQCMMENVEGDLKSNAHLMTMLNGLVIPAVRSQEAPIREKGLRCLGLCCLLDKPLAEENLGLFALCFNKGHEEMQVECAHIICDVLVTHGSSLFESQLCNIEQKTMYKMLNKATKLDDSPEVQAAVIEVLCKLMLARIVEDEELLRAMVIAYFDPSSADNLSLRQTLSYFLPVYCHSRNENQILLSKITVSTLHTLISMHGNIDEGEEMVAPAVIASQFADWTDPRKVFGALPAPGGNKTKDLVNYDLQVELASDICSKLASSGNKEDKKILCQMLGKLYVTEHGSAEKLQELYEQVLDIIDRKTVTDAVSRNAITKFETVIGKLVSLVEAEKSRVVNGNETMVVDETMTTEVADMSVISGTTEVVEAEGDGGETEEGETTTDAGEQETDEEGEEGDADGEEQ